MLRGMNSFGDMEEDGESDSSSACRNVSVNYAADSGVSPERRVSQDTDTESFTYEHFPVVCPTCRGAGQVHEDDLKTLVSFVPVKDKRLQPSRIFCKMVIMLFVCLCIAGPVAFFLIPRSVGVRLQYEESSRISIPDNVTLTPYIIVNSYLFVRNDNYLPVKLTNINVKVSWNRIILNSGTCIRNISISVPSRKSIKKSIETTIIFDGQKHGTAGFLFRTNCANGFHYHIFVKFELTAEVSFLTQDSHVSNNEYPYIKCYNASSIGTQPWLSQRRSIRMQSLP